MSTVADPAASMLAAVLLGDGRLPVGASSHSWGAEAAARHTGLADEDDLRSFLVERLSGPGLVDAAAAALACRMSSLPMAGGDDAGWDRLVVELDARVPSPAQRGVSDRLGRQLLRTGRRLWPDEGLDAASSRVRTPQPVALGLVAAAAGVSLETAAALSLHGAATMAASALVRLRGLDPVGAFAVVAELQPTVVELAQRAAAVRAPDELPSGGSVVVDLLAEVHSHEEARLFAS